MRWRALLFKPEILPKSFEISHPSWLKFAFIDEANRFPFRPGQTVGSTSSTCGFTSSSPFSGHE
jgi:hypothetical protein